jgi:hypothetical protein
MRNLLPERLSYNCEENVESSKSQWNVSSNNFAFGTCDHRKEVILHSNLSDGAYTHDLTPPDYECVLGLFCRQTVEFQGFPLEMPNSGVRTKTT